MSHLSHFVPFSSARLCPWPLFLVDYLLLRAVHWCKAPGHFPLFIQYFLSHLRLLFLSLSLCVCVWSSAWIIDLDEVWSTSDDICPLSVLFIPSASFLPVPDWLKLLPCSPLIGWSNMLMWFSITHLRSQRTGRNVLTFYENNLQLILCLILAYFEQ